MDSLCFFKNHQNYAWQNIPSLSLQITLFQQELKQLIAEKKSLEQKILLALTDSYLARNYFPGHYHRILSYQDDDKAYGQILKQLKKLELNIAYLDKKIELDQKKEQGKRLNALALDIKQQYQLHKKRLLHIRKNMVYQVSKTDDLSIFFSDLQLVKQLMLALMKLKNHLNTLNTSFLGIEDGVIWRGKFLELFQEVQDAEIAWQELCDDEKKVHFSQTSYQNMHIIYKVPSSLILSFKNNLTNFKYFNCLLAHVIRQEDSLKKLFQHLQTMAVEMEKKREHQDLSAHLKVLKLKQQLIAEKQQNLLNRCSQIRTELRSIHLDKNDFHEMTTADLGELIGKKKTQYCKLMAFETMLIKKLNDTQKALCSDIINEGPKALVIQNIRLIQSNFSQAQHEYNVMSKMQRLSFEQCMNELCFHEHLYQQLCAVLLTLSFVMMCAYIGEPTLKLIFLMISLSLAAMIAFAKYLETYGEKVGLERAYEAGLGVKMA